METSWSEIPERGGWLPLRTIYRITVCAGRPVSVVVVWMAAAYYVLTHTVARRASSQYLERLSTRRALTRSIFSTLNHFVEFGWSIIDKVRAWNGAFTLDNFAVEGEAEFQSIVSGGVGAVIFTAHHGNVEVARAVVESLQGVQINALMFTENSKKFNALLKHVNPHSALRLYPLEDLGIETILDLQNRVARGECVAIMADRVSAGAKDRLIDVEFLGERAPFPEGPFVLASLLECPVLTLWCTRERPEYYSVRIRLFAERISLPRVGRQEHLRSWIERYARELEAECIRQPYQWFNFFPYWLQGPARATEKSEPCCGLSPPLTKSESA